MNFEKTMMNTTISAKELRARLPKVVKQVRKGSHFTVLYRSRPAFRIVPMDEMAWAQGPLQGDSLYRAEPVGRSRDGGTAADHDSIVYGL